MVLALLSELSEFNTFNKNARNLIIGGTIYLGLNLLMAICMLGKYVGIITVRR